MQNGEGEDDQRGGIPGVVVIGGSRFVNLKLDRPHPITWQSSRNVIFLHFLCGLCEKCPHRATGCRTKGTWLCAYWEVLA